MRNTFLNKPSEMGTLYGVFSTKKNFGQLLLPKCWPIPGGSQKCPQKCAIFQNMGAFFNNEVGSCIFRWKTAEIYMYPSPIPLKSFYRLYLANRKKGFVKNRKNHVFGPFLPKMAQNCLKVVFFEKLINWSLCLTGFKLTMHKTKMNIIWIDSWIFVNFWSNCMTRE